MVKMFSRLFLSAFLVLPLLMHTITTDGQQFTPEALDAAQDLVNQQQNRHFRDIPTIEEDVPFILCATCKRLVRQLINTAATSKKTRPSELDYVEWMKNLCDPLEDEGFWITHLDIFEDKQARKLDIKRMSGPGHCEEECKTIGLACKTVIDAADSEIAEALYLNRSGRNSPESICQLSTIRSLKGSCGTTYPHLPSSRSFPGQDFRPKTKADFEREQKMAEKLLYGDTNAQHTEGKTSSGGIDANGPKDKDGAIYLNDAGKPLEIGEDGRPIGDVAAKLEQRADEL
jgi:hypothetical protein